MRDDVDVPSNEPRGAPRIRDVAAEAGVSYQTVSRVLNGSPRVLPETHRKVVEAIERTGFRPNRSARTLRSGRARSVAVVTPDTMLYGYAATLRGIEEAARAAGLSVGIRVVESERTEDVQRATDELADPSAGAVIVLGFDRVGITVLDHLNPDVPTVAAVEPAAVVRAGIPALRIDERTGAATATAHLLELGHATVHHIAIPFKERGNDRQAGWSDALTAAGVVPPPVLRAGWDMRAAYQAGLQLAADPQVTAIFAGNDDLALAVRRALYDAGRQVPTDVSLVGFDDAPGSAYMTPALTTVRMDFAALGKACVDAAQAVLVGAFQPDVMLPVPELIIRETTARHRPARV
ncbi:LacI family DNA-binding transcriptional regulator [Hamadaea tsunoensis]|uniref:LacI family DNA-binding transcriptional regulator n=1 Tax=Hamadaea tsunoensis TaxID=53368 RepID=UPI00054F43CE|nr:LacI family DNA-binding transcriptional regulator [Hamadaea tsunoensis]